jgi:hypothetical protein
MLVEEIGCGWEAEVMGCDVVLPGKSLSSYTSMKARCSCNSSSCCCTCVLRRPAHSKLPRDQPHDGPTRSKLCRDEEPKILVFFM